MSRERDDCECFNCAIFTLQENVWEQSKVIQELNDSNFHLHQQIQSQEMRHHEELVTIMRSVSQNTVFELPSLTIETIAKKQPPTNLPANSVGSRASIASSPFPRGHSPPTDIIVGDIATHQNVEGLQQLTSSECKISTIRQFHGSNRSKA
jgi:hypothetical protein